MNGPGSFPIFLLFFVVMWLGITTLLSYLSGWYRLMRLFPDTSEDAQLVLRGESGSMGSGVHFGRILILSTCSSGLRVGVSKMFGPFSKSFLVPWDQIRVRRYQRFFQKIAELRFGDPEQGRLVISEFLANMLASSANASWPETGPLPKEDEKTALRKIFKLWLLQVCLASAFFTLVPLFATPPKGRPPIWVGICFPAVVFGVVGAVQYFRRRSAFRKAAAAKLLQ